MNNLLAILKKNKNQAVISFLFLSHLLGNLFYFLNFELIITVNIQRISTFLVGGYCLYLLARKKFLFKKLLWESKAMILLFPVWIVYGTLGLFFVNDKISGLKEIIDILQNGLIILSCIICIDNEKTLKFLIKLAKFSAFIIIVIFFIQLVTQSYFPFSRYSVQSVMDYKIERNDLLLPTTLFFNENDMCAVLIPILVFCLFDMVIETNNKNQIINLIMGFFISIIMGISDSQISFTAFYVILFMLAVFLIQIKKKSHTLYRNLSYLGISAISTSVSFFFFSSILKEMLGNIHVTLDKIKSTFTETQNNLILLYIPHSAAQIITIHNTRLELILEGLKMFVHSWFLGVGPAAFKDNITAPKDVLRLTNPHNLWIEILSQYGIIIFIPFVFLFFKCIYSYIQRIFIVKTYNEMNYMFLTLMIALIFSTALPSSCISFYPIWLFWGIGFSGINFNEKKKVP